MRNLFIDLRVLNTSTLTPVLPEKIGFWGMTITWIAALWQGSRGASLMRCTSFSGVIATYTLVDTPWAGTPRPSLRKRSPSIASIAKLLAPITSFAPRVYGLVLTCKSLRSQVERLTNNCLLFFFFIRISLVLTTCAKGLCSTRPQTSLFKTQNSRSHTLVKSRQGRATKGKEEVEVE